MAVITAGPGIFLWRCDLTGWERTLFSGEVNDPSLAAMHNVAGEIKGAECAMRYAVAEGLSEITIVHDYEGIAKWCLGEWKAGKEGTQAYKAFYDSIKSQVHVTFQKVKGHSGDHYNDMADMLAKQALGLSDLTDHVRYSNFSNIQSYCQVTVAY